MNPTGMSVAARALLALALLVGFYALALGIVVVLLYLPYAELVYTGRLHLKLALLAVVGAGFILFAIIPRSDHWEPPGPKLGPADQPEVFALIDETANLTKQAGPEEVYLVPDVNAWVAQQEGVMGFGGRRVMGLGLPLLAAVSVDQLRAILAHEFGHFHGGDTRFGQWVYATRAALGRTIASLQARDSWLQAPFVLYGKLFLRITHAVSRHQERLADLLAASVAGPRPLSEGLVRIHTTAHAFAAYWANDVEPVVQAGHRPPILAGFSQFTTGTVGCRVVEAATDRARLPADGDAYDTHPPLHERLEALKALPDGPAPSDDRPAISLLKHVGQLELDLFDQATSGQWKTLPAVSWEQSGDSVYPAQWARAAATIAPALEPIAVEDLVARSEAMLGSIAARLTPGQDRQEEVSAEVRRYSIWLLGATLAAALTRNGWSVRALPGEPALLQRDGTTVDPFDVVQRLGRGEMDDASWRQRCAQVGISSLELPPVAPDATLATDDSPLQGPPPELLASSPPAPARQIACWKCHESIPVTVETQGRKTRCPRCGTKQQLPVWA